MPLFKPREQFRKKPKGKSISSRLKKLFQRKPSSGVPSGPSMEDTMRHKTMIMFLRSMIVLIIGCSWWVAAPAIFLSLLPGFSAYLTALTNSGQTVAGVYQFWQVVPEILLFGFSVVWTGGVIDMIVGRPVLETVF